MVSSLTSDDWMEGSVPCQAEATLLIRSEIILSPSFRLQSEEEFNNKLRCQV